ncbi:hypothetical protein TNCV_3396571 [Trichonephila clavipes]|nr:hypothetical protein TNCV_3396571 [Trichonephila clavipes]
MSGRGLKVMAEVVESLFHCRSEKVKGESLTSLGNGMRSAPPSHIEMYLGIEVERPGLRGSFLISGLKESLS